MKIAVTGGRPKNLPSYCDRDYVFNCLSSLAFEIKELIEGEALGIDQWSAEWARVQKVSVIPIPITRTMWRLYGRGAGHHRNGLILAEKPELLIAFPGGPGTQDMIEQAHERQVKVIKF